MYSLILVLLISYVQAQQQQDLCHCSCCIGQFCNPTYVGVISTPSCTSESCRTYCRNSYLQCRGDDTNGQIFSQCSSNVAPSGPSFSCQCNCCRTGSATCSPSFVGYSTAYTCQPGACSISCVSQYPNQCVSDQNGQTNGVCIGTITTTTTTTTTTGGSGSGYKCSCLCCSSGSNCSPNSEVGVTSASQCTPAACTAACQNQYPTACPSNSYIGYSRGVCSGSSSSTTRCGCQCCGLSGCPTYDVYTNADCSSCATLCSERCGNTNPLTVTCGSNTSIKGTASSSLLVFLSILIFMLPLYSSF